MPTPSAVELKITHALSEDLRPLADEAVRLHESVLISSQNQFEQMKLWRGVNLLLGLPTAVLAAIAGARGLSSDSAEHVAAILALIAAGFGATLTTLNPSRRVSQSQAAANSYLEVQTALRQFVAIDIGHMSFVDARDKLEKLSSRRDEINRTADPPGRLAYWLANRNLNKGRQTYAVDQASQAD